LRIAVIGTGYVGLVAGVCFSELGNDVTCVDVDREKIRALEQGRVPIYEPGLDSLLGKNLKAGRLKFTTDLGSAVRESTIIFIAVGTPAGGDGSADLRYVKEVAASIAGHMDSYRIIVNKSTVPVGTAELVKGIITGKTSHKADVVSNPEFLREGSALNDFMKPDRVVIGCDSREAAEAVKKLYSPLNCEVLVTDAKSSELIKYASNTFLAVKISFINEIANLCEKVGADIAAVSRGMGLDSRIGKHFLNAGAGYGGSCFPKDVKAIIHTAELNNQCLEVAKAAEEVNRRQKIVPAQKAEKLLGGLQGRKVALLGLAFKPNTDDMREASSIEIADYLKGKGAEVTAYDPIASENAAKLIQGISYAASAFDAVKGADAVILVTEWDEFREIDLAKVKSLMSGDVLVDARNMCSPEDAGKQGFRYEGIGRK
jgi:UDPglucose 6-dehydrogenase